MDSKRRLIISRKKNFAIQFVYRGFFNEQNRAMTLIHCILFFLFLAKEFSMITPTKSIAKQEFTTCYISPIGAITITVSNNCLQKILFQENPCGGVEQDPLLVKSIEQLEEYFAGKRKKFSLPLAPQGTFFQKKVWAALQDIPYGQTQSYKNIAEKIENPKAMRAVGLANSKNPIAIIIPCHRVIGADGSLTGYAGGLDKKTFLLELENPNVKKALR